MKSFFSLVIVLVLAGISFASPPRARNNPPVAVCQCVPPVAVVATPKAVPTSGVVVTTPVVTQGTYYAFPSSTSSCPGGVCPSAGTTYQRRGIFR